MGFLRRTRAAGPFDPRVARAEYEAGRSDGQRLNVLLGAMDAAIPDIPLEWAAHRAVFVVTWAMAETDNGTLDQYFYSSTGDLAAELPDAARRFGADGCAAIFARALAFFDPDRVGDRAYRQDRLEALTADEREAFDALTDELDDEPSLYAAMTRYVEAHPETFFT